MSSRRGSHQDPTAGEIIVKFKAFDLNKDGVIDRRELGYVLQHVDSSYWNSRRINRIMELIDSNSDKCIQYDEFVRWTFGNGGSGREHNAFMTAMEGLAPPRAKEVSSSGDELHEAIEAFFRVHAEGTALDIDRFTGAQAVLASALDEAADRLVSVEAFVDVSGRADASAQLQAFADWQLKVLRGKGLQRRQIIDLLKRCTETAKQQRRAAPKRRPMADRQATRPREEGRSQAADLTVTQRTRDSPRRASADGPIPILGGMYKVDGSGDAGRTTESRVNGVSRGSGVRPVTRPTPTRDQTRPSLGMRLCEDQRFVDLANYMKGGGEQDERLWKSGKQGVSRLAAALVRDTSSDEERAWVIYHWVCNNIEYDVDGLHGRSPKMSCDAEDVLRNRKSVCSGYASIFFSLASEAGLDVRTISGNARSISDRVGRDVIGENVGAHAWNAVKLGPEWSLIDCTWGSGTTSETEFTRDVTPYYFGVPPRESVFSHFPDNAEWQLMTSPVRYPEFINQPVVCGRAFFGRYELEFMPYRPSGSISWGQNVQLRVPSDVSLMLQPEGKCSQDRDRTTGVVTIRCSEPGALKIFASSDSRNKSLLVDEKRTTWYNYVCELAVQ